MAEVINTSQVNGQQYNRAGLSQLIYRHDANGAYSGLINVLPGWVAVITAFGLTKHRLVPSDPHSPWTHHSMSVLKRMTTEYSSKSMQAAYCSCEDFEAQMSNPSIVFEDVMVPCGWKLTACNNVKVITMPGSYILENDHIDHADPVYVEVMFITVEDAMLFPRCAIFGN